MARVRKKKQPRNELTRGLDATPERVAKSEASEFVNPAEIDSSEQTITRVRRFRDTWIDRMYRRGQLNHAQWFACGWYRDLHSMAFTPQRLCADYGQGSGGAGSGNYGQPFNETQQRKRALYRHAREFIAPNLLRMVEDVILHDDMPPFSNARQRERFAKHFAAAVQPIAEHVQAPGWWLTKAVDQVSVSK